MSNLNKVEAVYSFWGRLPFLYAAQDYITFMGRPGYIRRQAVKKLNAKSSDKILEVACGTGRNFSYLVEVLGKEGVLIGFDYVQEMLDAAKQLCEREDWKNIKLKQGDAAELNIGEENFDGVLSVLGISAIPGWEQALKRCLEVLRPGGRLVVCDGRLFTGFLKILNPLVKLIYSKFAAWDPAKNIPEKMKEIFGNVETENINLGTFFIAVAVKMEE
ncbi:class I SAM-dependent methyltransferase [Candidatus Wolfebacteria bacterium]|nr:class I SAM-dependent methyltransferase [Candidatus Wolfebacteria bacterium]